MKENIKDLSALLSSYFINFEKRIEAELQEFDRKKIYTEKCSVNFNNHDIEEINLKLYIMIKKDNKRMRAYMTLTSPTSLFFALDRAEEIKFAFAGKQVDDIEIIEFKEE